MPEVLFEVCTDSAVGAAAAQAGGADRVELCANLLEGGTTPSIGAVEWVRGELEIGVMVLVRPRGGDFVFTEHEMDVILKDIEAVKRIGVDGVVVGSLHPDGTLHQEQTAAMIRAARPMQVTFHRAFDMCADPDGTLEQLIELGVDRILTSGQRDSMIDGLELIADINRRAAGRICIMPGGSILESNIRQVIEATGVSEVHFAAGASRESSMVWRNPECSMGCGEIPGEYELRSTNSDLVRAFIRAAGVSSDP